MTNFQLIPFLNKKILEILLDKWNMAVTPNTEWKSKKNAAIGTKNKEEPKPPTVPNISANSARKIKRYRYSKKHYLYTEIATLN
jgi:hypothetical protein